VVRGETATASGYLVFPLLVGLIASSIISGQIVSRTGRYKTVVLVGLAFMAVGLLLMSQLRTDTEYLPLFGWMFVTGLGIGPTFAVFTIIVQNAVPFSQLGVATSNLTFFRQIGGSVGLAIAGTLFGTTIRDQLPVQLTPVIGQIVAQLPAELRDQAAAAFADGTSGSTLDLNDLTGVGQSFGGVVIDGAPAQFQALLEPFRAALDGAFNDTLSLAIANTFFMGVLAAVLALAAALVLRELPLRTTHAPERGPSPSGGPMAEPATIEA
jgi:MFS family permease